MAQFWILIAIALGYSFQLAPADQSRGYPSNAPFVTKAIVTISGPSPDVHGQVTFSQDRPGTPTRILGMVFGLTEGLHGFHIHALGNLTGGCGSSGSHYNPFKLLHGGPKAQIRHVGDLGNIRVTAEPEGGSLVDFSDSQISLNGPYSIVGRALVIHAGEDDLGLGGDEESTKTGNAGARVGCGVIAIAEEN